MFLSTKVGVIRDLENPRKSKNGEIGFSDRSHRLGPINQELRTGVPYV